MPKHKHHLVIESAGVIYVEKEAPYLLFTLKPETPNGADHIRISLPKNRDSPDAVVDVHLTRRWAGEKTKHKPIAQVRVGDLADALQRIMREAHEAWLSNTSHVRLDDPVFANAVTFHATGEQCPTFMERFSLPRGAVGVRKFEDFIDPTFDLMLDSAIDVDKIPPEMAESGPHVVVRVTDDDEDLEHVGWLGYFEAGPHGRPGPTGWYLTRPYNGSEVMQAAMLRIGGADFATAIETIRRGLQDIDAA